MDNICRKCPFSPVCSPCDNHMNEPHEPCNCCGWPKIKVKDFTEWWSEALYVVRLKLNK